MMKKILKTKKIALATLALAAFSGAEAMECNNIDAEQKVEARFLCLTQPNLRIDKVDNEGGLIIYPNGASITFDTNLTFENGQYFNAEHKPVIPLHEPLGAIGGLTVEETRAYLTRVSGREVVLL
jgi:hypothetical protein